METARAAARETARAALDELPPGIGATSEVLDGAPVAALAAISARLDLLVCGSRGYGAIRSVMAGGVSRGLAHEAACPLLVVPRGPAAGHSLLDRDDASAANSPIDAARA